MNEANEIRKLMESVMVDESTITFDERLSKFKVMVNENPDQAAQLMYEWTKTRILSLKEFRICLLTLVKSL